MRLIVPLLFLLFGAVLVVTLVPSEFSEKNVAVLEENTVNQVAEANETAVPAEEKPGEAYRVMFFGGWDRVRGIKTYDVDNDGVDELLFCAERNGDRYIVLWDGKERARVERPRALWVEYVPVEGGFVVAASGRGTVVYSANGEKVKEYERGPAVFYDGSHLYFLDNGVFYREDEPVAENVEKAFIDEKTYVLEGRDFILLRGCQVEKPKGLTITKVLGEYRGGYVVLVGEGIVDHVALLSCEGLTLIDECERGVADAWAESNALIYACYPEGPFKKGPYVFFEGETFEAGGVIVTRVGDVDGDGRADPVYHSSLTGLYYRGEYLPLRGFYLADVFDIDGDGVDEVIGLSAGEVVIVDGGVEKHPTDAEQLHYAGRADIDGDGAREAILTDFYSPAGFYVVDAYGGEEG